MIDIRPNSLTVDGVRYAAENYPTAWASKVSGSVLEIGLGHYILGRLVASNPQVARHVIVEQSEELIKAIPVLDKTEVVHATFPSVHLRGRFDYILMDYEGSWRDTSFAAWYLNDGGAIFVRTGTT